MSNKTSFGFGTFFFGFILALLAVLIAGYFVKPAYDELTFSSMLESSSQGQAVLELADQNEHPLYYSTASIWAQVEEGRSPFMDLFGELVPMSTESGEEIPGAVTYDQQILNKLLAQAQECGTTVNEEELTARLQGLWGADVRQYSFVPGDSGENEAWTVTMVSNNGLYEDLATFKADFNICAAGGTLYPERMNDSWLMFYSSCGAGYAEEPAGNTCADVREAIEPTLEFR